MKTETGLRFVQVIFHVLCNDKKHDSSLWDGLTLIPFLNSPSHLQKREETNSEVRVLPLDPPIKQSNGFLILPGTDNFVQMWVPCSTCPSPCRSLDFKKWKESKRVPSIVKVVTCFSLKVGLFDARILTASQLLFLNLNHCRPQSKSRMNYKDTLYIRAHLEAAQHEYFAKEDSKKRKVTFKTVERYLTSVAEQCCFRMYECLPNISNRSNSHGANLPPNKKIKVTGQNLHELWKKHKPVLNL